MTTLLEEIPEPDDTETVAQRLRMHMGDKKLSRSRLALKSGIKRSALSSKLDGVTEFSIGEIVSIAHAIDRPWLWVLTGKDDGRPGPGGGAARAPIPFNESPLPGSNRGPLAYLVAVPPAETLPDDAAKPAAA